jgi:hypothetical protein
MPLSSLDSIQDACYKKTKIMPRSVNSVAKEQEKNNETNKGYLVDNKNVWMAKMR